MCEKVNEKASTENAYETQHSRRLRRFRRRSCFFVSGNQHAYIVDCGTSTDGKDRVPDLTADEIRGAEYLFLTHSHRDHTGAVEYAERMGFSGPVFMSAQTYRQLGYKPKNAVIMDSTAPEVELLPDFVLQWGRTGHCCGAVWYAITCEGKTAFFSGDYREGDPFTGTTRCGT